MNNKFTIPLAMAGLVALCLAASNNSKSGGVPALTDRLVALESAMQAQGNRISALESTVQTQAQELEALRQQIAAIPPSPFSEAEAGRLHALAGVMWVHRDQGEGWGNQVFLDGSLLVRRSAFTTELYVRDGEFTSSWTMPNEAGWTFFDLH